jgi:hypothetical protein
MTTVVKINKSIIYNSWFKKINPIF